MQVGQEGVGVGRCGRLGNLFLVEQVDYVVMVSSRLVVIESRLQIVEKFLLLIYDRVRDLLALIEFA